MPRQFSTDTAEVVFTLFCKNYLFIVGQSPRTGSVYGGRSAKIMLYENRQNIAT
jgi:hypothetical protein